MKLNLFINFLTKNLQIYNNTKMIGFLNSYKRKLLKHCNRFNM
jgi:hypothetical protein